MIELVLLLFISTYQGEIVAKAEFYETSEQCEQVAVSLMELADEHGALVDHLSCTPVEVEPASDDTL